MVQKAIMLGCPHFLQYLLDLGHDANYPGSINAMPIFMAISLGNFRLTQVLLRSERVDIRVLGPRGGTVVHYVLRAYKFFGRLGSLDVISLIVNHPHFLRGDLDLLDSLNLTPLSLSARIGDICVMKLLVGCGARYDGWRGVQALYLSAKGGYGDVIRYLVDLGVSVNGTLRAGRTPLFCAVRASRLGMVSLLLSNGARQHISLGTSGSIPALAIREQNPLILKVLLSWAKHEPTAVRFEYIHAVLGQESSDLLKQLLRIPWFNLGEVNWSTGDTILHYIVTCSKPLPSVAYERLISFGCNKFWQNPLLGGTPINWAIRKQNMDALRAMIKKGEYLGFEDRVTGASIVHDAVDGGILEILKMVLDAGAPPQRLNRLTGRFPIHHAVKMGSMEMTSLLLRKTSAYNTKETMTGNTPLHIAVMNGHGRLVDYLISGGAYLGSRNFIGETPKMLADGRELAGHSSGLWRKLR
ncbi:ankyrin repeat-containing domain protein [Tuber brumale]|nr:ankyrin repeat-containing domain protein [Tuber brumale]